MRFYSFVVAAFAAVAWSTFCLAWGGERHQLVALIAEDHLTPAAKAMVNDPLDGGDISDAEVASWADEERRVQRETAPGHYVNVPYDPSGYHRERDGKEGANVIDAIESQAKLLADKSQPREKRIEALKFVVHLVGDIHQPLHCADRNGDKGGNGRLVMWLDKRKAENLHMVWDTGLIRELVGRRPIADVADALSQTITSAQRKEWLVVTPETWANECYAVAVKVYAGVPEDGPPPNLGRDYAESNVPIVAEQLKRGGVRLAMVLKLAFEGNGDVASLPREIFKFWIHSHEDDTPVLKVYRAKGFKFPPARGRDGFEIKEKGEFVLYGIGPTDRPVKVSGTWKANGKDEIVATFPNDDPKPLKLSIVTVDGEMLKIKK